MVSLLDTIFTEFDEIAEQNQVEKIKTIGDAYMAISKEGDHTWNGLVFASQILEKVRVSYPKLKFRIGIHCGSVVAGVIG